MKGQGEDRLGGVLSSGDVLSVTKSPMFDAVDWLTSGAGQSDGGDAAGGGDLAELTDGVPTALGGAVQATDSP